MTITTIIKKWAHPLLLRGSLREEFKQDLIDLIVDTECNVRDKVLKEFKEVVREVYN